MLLDIYIQKHNHEEMLPSKLFSVYEYSQNSIHVYTAFLIFATCGYILSKLIEAYEG